MIFLGDSFFTWRGLGFLLSGSRIKNIIIKFSRGFSNEVYFWITCSISFFEDLLGGFFLPSSW